MKFAALSINNFLPFALFVIGSMLAIYGAIISLAMLDKPSNWFCRVRGWALISMFTLASAGFCAAVFNGVYPNIIDASYTFVTGLLCALFGQSVRRSSIRKMDVRAARRKRLAGSVR